MNNNLKKVLIVIALVGIAHSKVMASELTVHSNLYDKKSTKEIVSF